MFSDTSLKEALDMERFANNIASFFLDISKLLSCNAVFLWDRTTNRFEYFWSFNFVLHCFINRCQCCQYVVRDQAQNLSEYRFEIAPQ
jgi:hypothetical protein